MKITKKTKLKEIINNEKIVNVLLKYQFPCLSCPFAQMEMENLEIGKVCEMYNIDATKVIKEINKVIKDEKGNR